MCSNMSLFNQMWHDRDGTSVANENQSQQHIPDSIVVRTPSFSTQLPTLSMADSASLGLVHSDCAVGEPLLSQTVRRLISAGETPDILEA